MEIACLAIFGCVGLDLVKHVVEISRGYRSSCEWRERGGEESLKYFKAHVLICMKIMNFENIYHNL